MRNVLYGRWSSRRSPVGRNRPVPQCHGWCRSPRHMRSLCSSCAPLAEDLRHTRSPSTTAPHRPADASCFVPIAGGEIELALLCATAQGTLPASGKARCACCARRDCLGAPQARAPPMRWRPAAASRICTSACAPDPGSKPKPKPKPKPNPSPGPGAAHIARARGHLFSGAPGSRRARRPFFARCASPPGTARGAGGSSGPRGSTRTCSACATSAGRGWHLVPFLLQNLVF